MSEKIPTGEQGGNNTRGRKKESSIIIETPVGASGRKISSEVEEGAKRMLEGIKREKELREKRERGELLSAQEVATLRALEIKRVKNAEGEGPEEGEKEEKGGKESGREKFDRLLEEGVFTLEMTKEQIGEAVDKLRGNDIFSEEEWEDISACNCELKEKLRKDSEEEGDEEAEPEEEQEEGDEEAGSAPEGSGVHEGAWEVVGSGPEVETSPEVSSSVIGEKNTHGGGSGFLDDFREEIEEAGSGPESSSSGLEDVSSGPVSGSGPEMVGSGVETLEQTPLEKLDKARDTFAEDYVEMEKIAKEREPLFKRGNTTTAEIISEIEGGSLESYEHYKEALREYRDHLKESRLEGLEGEALEKEAKQIILETVAGEANKLYDAKTDIKLEKCEKDSGLEIFGKNIKKIGTWYRKLPLKYKMVLPVALLGTAVATLAGAVVPSTIITGVFVGSLAQRLLGGAAVGVATEGGWQKIQEREEKTGVEKKFKDGFLAALEEKNDDFDQKLLEIEGGKKAARVRRIAAGGIVGSFIGGGYIGRAIDWWRGEAPIPEVTAPVSEIPPVEAIVQPGDSVWSITEDQLQEKGYFDGLKGSADEILAKKTYLIDAIKDKIAANPNEFGIGSGNADKIFPGDKLDLTSIFKEKSLLDGLFDKANGLSSGDVENILNYNNISDVAGGEAEKVATGYVSEAGADTIPTEQTATGYAEGAGTTTGVEQLAIETAKIENLANQIGEEVEKQTGSRWWDVFGNNKGDLSFYKDKPVSSLMKWFNNPGQVGPDAFSWGDGGAGNVAERSFRTDLAERLLQDKDVWMDALSSHDGYEKTTVFDVLKKIAEKQLKQ